MTLSIEVYEADGTTLVDTIDPGQWRSLRGAEVISHPGDHTLVLKRVVEGNEPNPAVALIEEDRIAQVVVDGVRLPQMLIQETDEVEIAPPTQGEEGGELLTVTGPGSMGIFDRVKWHPDPGLEILPFNGQRPLSFAALRLRDDDPAGPQGAWPLGYGQLPDYDGDNWFGRPKGYIDTAGPDGDGPEWIAHSDTRTLYAPVGLIFYRQLITLDDDHDQVLIQAAFDDEGQLWDADVPVIKSEGVYKGQCSEASIPMSAGEHLIAGYVRNLNALRMGVTFAGWSITDGMPDQLLFRADSSTCRVLAFPAKPPGFTPTEVIRLGVDEAQDRNQLLDLVMSFISASDTYHHPLLEVTDITVKAPADSLLTTLLMLGETYLDLRMQKTGVGLDAYIRGTLGAPSREG